MIPGLFPDLAQVAPVEGSDVAYTPAVVAEACARFLHQECLMRGSWWEPCAGSGNWLQVLGDPQRGLGPGMATELDPQAESVRSGRAVQGDALQGPPGDFEPENIVTNPPFSISPQLLRSQPDGGWCPPRPTVLRRLNWATGELL